MPFGASSSTVARVRARRCSPYARANARENAASEPYPAARRRLGRRRRARCAAATPPARAAAAAAARPATPPSPPPAADRGDRARSARAPPAPPRSPARPATRGRRRSAPAGDRPPAHVDRFRRIAGRRAPRPAPCGAMATWSEFAAAAPALAERVQERFDAHKHKTMATIRKDGSPRISGTESQFQDGELFIGSMWKAVKALDLQRDPRFAHPQRDRRPRGRRLVGGQDRRHRPRDRRRGGGQAPQRRGRAPTGRATRSGSTSPRSRPSTSTTRRRSW